MVDGENDRIMSGAVFGIEGGEPMSMLEIVMMGELPYTGLGDGVCTAPTAGEGFSNLFAALEG